MANNSIQIFQYNGSPITFQMGDCVMVNATEMAKPFGKSANHWLRNKSTEEFIKELARLRNCNPVDLVQVTNGGNGEQGTYRMDRAWQGFPAWKVVKGRLHKKYQPLIPYNNERSNQNIFNQIWV